MTRILSFFAVFALLLTSCEGPQGPPGFDGFDGADGVNIVAQSFERTIDFTSTNNYQETVEVPLDIELFESDMVLVYHLRGQVDGFDVWKALPETIYINAAEEFQYNFEHNFDFITIFIESHPNFDFNLLTDDERINQTFRVVILPVDFVNSKNIDVNNYQDVRQYIK
ncbi:dihydrolipoamide dehydrogenase [Lacinutrix chionoecetis]